MNKTSNNPIGNSTNRRDFIKTTGKIAAVGALAGVEIPHVYAQESNTINLALVGCGGRGGGATMDAMNSKYGPVKLVAMADVFQSRLKGKYESLKKERPEQVDVSEERRFLGFDAYKKAADCLKPGDVMICATPPAFRWVHLKYAIEKGINIFLEKPVAVDGPSARRVLQLAQEADKKGIRVAIGLMCRHCRSRQALFQKIREGVMGDVLMMRAYRQHGPSEHCFVGPKPDNMTEVLYQVKNFHSFLWSGGGLYSDFNIHQVDEMCWMKNEWPVKAEGIGGRHYRGNAMDQNFDNYAVEFTFADGSKGLHYSRIMTGCNEQFNTLAHGSKGAAVICEREHTTARCRIHSGQDFSNKKDIIWQFGQNEPNPYVMEWDDFLDAIRNNKPYNEAKRGAEASLVTVMGRYAAHTGQAITFDQMLNHEHEFAPDLEKLTMESPAPLQLGPDGKYPHPEPGKKKNREY